MLTQFRWNIRENSIMCDTGVCVRKKWGERIVWTSLKSLSIFGTGKFDGRSLLGEKRACCLLCHNHFCKMVMNVIVTFGFKSVDSYVLCMLWQKWFQYFFMPNLVLLKCRWFRVTLKIHWCSLSGDFIDVNMPHIKHEIKLNSLILLVKM